jgi:GAF domain-containing protein
VPTFLERFRRDPARVRLVRLERLQALLEELSAAQTRDEVLRVVMEHGRSLVDASGGALYWERAPGELGLVHAMGLSDGCAGRGSRVLAEDPAPVAEAYRTGRPVWLASRAELEGRFPELGGSVGRDGPQAWAALPLAAGGGRGAIGLAFHERRAFDEEERSFVLAAARQCTAAAERARLFDASNRLAERLRQLLSVASTLSAAATPRDVAAGAFRALGPLGACAAEIHGVEGDDRVALLARHGRGSEHQGSAVPVDAPTPAAEVVRTGRAVWLETPREIAERYPQLERERAAREERAWAGVPLLASGQAIGALVAIFPEPRQLEPDDRTYLRLVAQPCAHALERARPFQDALRTRAAEDVMAALLAATCASAPVGLAILDREMRFLRVNDVFARADGISADAHPGRSPLELLRGLKEPLLEAFHEVLATGRAVELEVAPELPGASHGGVGLATTLFPVRLDGAIACVGLLLRGGS